MNMYLRAIKNPTQMIVKISHKTDKAIENDFPKAECGTVRERERSSSLWIRSSSGEIFLGGGKCGRGRASQLNISGVNGLAGIGIFVRGQSNSYIDTCFVFLGRAFPRRTIKTLFSRSVFAALVRLDDANVMPNEIGLLFLFFICHLDTWFVILPVIYPVKLPNNVSQNKKNEKLLNFFLVSR